MPDRTLILSMRDIKQLLTTQECVPIQEEVFGQSGRGTAWNGENAWVYPNPEQQRYPGLVKLMSGAVEPDWWGTKSLLYQDGDPRYRNRTGILTLFRAKDALPVAVMEALYITNVRTGAGAAVATKHLARSDAKTIGVLGTGATARFSLIAHAALDWKPEKVFVFSRSRERREEFVKDMEAEIGWTVTPLGGAEEVVRRADILITGTASHSPVFDADWVKPGTHVNAMGQRSEVDPRLFAKSLNVGDERQIAIEDGKLSIGIAEGVITAEDVHCGLGDIVAGVKEGRSSEDQITLFDSSGLCIQDVAAGIYILKKAQNQGVGTPTDFFSDEPLW